MMTGLPLILAHESGWDELLLFVVPIVVVLAWVRWAEKRARARLAEAREVATNIPDDADA